MANQDHLNILAKGVEAWNGWRLKNRSVIPDLVEVDCSGALLDGIDLSSAVMNNATLERASLATANLASANLTQANLRNANLENATLGWARLKEARLVGANLQGASFVEANLKWAFVTGANLRGAELVGADFTGTVFGGTSLGHVDLRGVIGLSEAEHVAPSSIGLETMYRSGGVIPEPFLRGCGVPESFITYMRSLTGSAFEFYSCFISYSTNDQDFADRLYADLQARGVRCWFAPHDIQGGRKIHEQIEEAIRVYDKLLLILSDASMNSNWVKTEAANARARERQQNRQMLFPITLVPFDRIREWKCFDADAGIDTAREVREYFIPDFSRWKEHDAYSVVLERLVRDLKAGPSGAPNARPAS